MGGESCETILHRCETVGMNKIFGLQFKNAVMCPVTSFVLWELTAGPGRIFVLFSKNCNSHILECKNNMVVFGTHYNRSSFRTRCRDSKNIFRLFLPCSVHVAAYIYILTIYEYEYSTNGRN